MCASCLFYDITLIGPMGYPMGFPMGYPMGYPMGLMSVFFAFAYGRKRIKRPAPCVNPKIKKKNTILKSVLHSQYALPVPLLRQFFSFGL